MTAPEPTYLYLRKSHESETAQEASIERQDGECRPYADKKRYQIVRVYTDHASGSKDQDKREDFMRMLADVASGKDGVKVILCWNRARFGRLDNIDGAFAAKVLRSNGVILDTVREGVFDYNQAGDRWKDMALSEAGKATSLSLSADSLSGRIRALKDGYWPNGAIPYGYDRLYVSAASHHVVRRNVRTTRPQGTKLKLQINEAEAEIVRWIFRQFVEGDVSVLSIAADLNARLVPPPDTIQKKKHHSRTGYHVWSDDTLKGILRNRAYVGIASIGAGRLRKRQVFNRATPLEIPGACPAIIDQDVFRLAQAKFARNQQDHRRVQPKKAGTLSGFVYCGHCDHRLVKRFQKGTTYYACASGVKRPHFGCRQWSVREDEVMPKLRTTLVEKVDQEILARSQARPPEKPTEKGVLETHLDGLKRQLATGTERYLSEMTPESILPDLAARLKTWKDEIADVERRLQLMAVLDDKGGLASFREWWRTAKDTLVVVKPAVFEDVTLGGGSLQVEPHVFRELLARLGVKVTVLWEQGPFRPAIKSMQIDTCVSHTVTGPHAMDSESVFRMSFRFSA